MIETTLLSPGLLAQETDLSFIGQKPVVVGAAIVGPTVLGQVGVPTVVTTYSDFTSRFGSTIKSGSATNSKVFTYFTSIAAYNYFLNGGQSLLVTRVASGSYTPASHAIVASGSATAFTLETISEGTIMNSGDAVIAGTTGSLVSGSVDNIRWQITNANSGSGKFDLVIRRGNDSDLQPSVLESFSGLNLDPYSPNYVAKVIGDIKEAYDSTNNQLVYSGSFVNKSRYVRIKDVLLTTPNFFDNDGRISNVAYTSSIPLNASGGFAGATGTIKDGTLFYENITETNAQGLEAANYTNALALLNNKDDYQFNMMVTPGLFSEYNTHKVKIDAIISSAESRGDFVSVIDPLNYSVTATPDAAVTQASNFNTSYGAMYFPWLMVVDPNTAQFVWVPASTLIPSIFAFNDSVSEPWFAPAGINRGGLNTVVRAQQKLSQSSRNTLYGGKVNPIATFPGQGVAAYGQKTLQTKASALDRINVRRLLIDVKNQVGKIANSLLFEQNTSATRNIFLSQVNPLLTSIQQRQGLYAFKVVMDDTLNSPDVIDRNELKGQIYLQPTKTIEFIYIDFIITPTGATFS